jgi:hypothetical protein
MGHSDWLWIGHPPVVENTLAAILVHTVSTRLFHPGRRNPPLPLAHGAGHAAHESNLEGSSFFAGLRRL